MSSSFAMSFLKPIWFPTSINITEGWIQVCCSSTRCAADKWPFIAWQILSSGETSQERGSAMLSKCCHSISLNMFFIQCTNKSLKKGVRRNSQLHLCIWYDTPQQSIANLVIATQVKCCRTYRSSYSSGHDISESDRDIIACILLIQKEVITEWEKKFKITWSIHKNINPSVADSVQCISLAFFTYYCPQWTVCL